LALDPFAWQHGVGCTCAGSGVSHWVVAVAACDGDIVSVIDGGVIDVDDAGHDAPDAGNDPDADAGVDEVVDAGFVEEVCDGEDVEYNVVCEDDADWCSPRDQARAYYDLAAGWSRRENGMWILEVRFWGDFLHGGDVERLESVGFRWNGSPTGVPTDFPPSGGNAGCLGEAVGEANEFGPWTNFAVVGGTSKVCRVCEDSLNDCRTNAANCAGAAISTDGSTIRLVFPDNQGIEFWAVSAGNARADLRGCTEWLRFFPSRGGSADVAEFVPIVVPDTCSTPAR
jgi:hypothetical protein